MMSYEMALNGIRRIAEKEKNTLFQQSLALAEGAIIKQVKEKPIEFCPNKYSCPNNGCKALLTKGVLYCEHCGQALNWGDENAEENIAKLLSNKEIR